MNIQSIRSSCGVGEISNMSLGTPEQIIEVVKKFGFKIFVFTDQSQNSPGANLAKYIEDNKLGELTASKSVHNYNYGLERVVTVWLYYPDRNKLDSLKTKVVEAVKQTVESMVTFI